MTLWEQLLIEIVQVLEGICNRGIIRVSHPLGVQHIRGGGGVEFFWLVSVLFGACIETQKNKFVHVNQFFSVFFGRYVVPSK
jgi:hypothetical protein